MGTGCNSEQRRRGGGSRSRTSSSIVRTAAVAGAAALIGFGTPSTNVAQAQGNEEVRGSAPEERQETEYHEVREGDTLWDLSGQYYGDPYSWPRLWSYNSHITNPHWIYPGDIIYLNPPSEREEEGKPRADKGKEGDGEPTLEEGLRLSVGGFLVGEEPEFVGRIAASPKEARMLGEFDSCWVGFGEDGYTDQERDEMKDKNIKELRDPGDVKKKDRFAIVEHGGKLKNEDGDVIGHKYIVLGSLVVTDTKEDKLDTAYIDQSWREIERGAFLLPYERQLRLVDHEPADKNMVATIVDSLRGTFDFGQFEYVFLDKGADDGVRIGNRFYIYQREAGLPKDWGNETPDEIPWRRVGRVRVIDVTKNYSTALITKSKREIAIGDRLEMYEGN